ncbi:hypothetical protein BH11MYX4_BH11MYX4_20100 [soil metagenome]
MTPAQFRKLALSLGDVEERPHFDRAAFRTPRKTFATLGRDRRVNLHVEPAERRDALMEEMPETFFALGGWTRLGYIAVDLATVPDGLLRELVADAYRDALPAPKKPKKPSAKKKGA